jgi:hypothetical protein
MTRTVWIAGLTLVVLGGGVAGGQEAAVDVRTWAGQALRLSSPSFENFYTVVPSPPPGVVAAPTLQTSAMAVGSAATTTNVQAGATRPIEGYVAPQAADSKQGRRQQNVITLTRGGVEIHVPLTSVTTMTFVRAPMTTSSLPPYARGDHYRYSATLDLTDGSQVAGDYVNLGTAVLRGTTPQGTVDIPWQDIQTLRFQR